MSIIEEKIYKIMKENKLYGDITVHNDNAIEIEISGDWKHEHLKLRWLIFDNFNVKDYKQIVTEEDGSDYYTAIHYFKL